MENNNKGIKIEYIILALIGVLLLSFALTYFWISSYYQTHFSKNTYIIGMDVSNKSVDQVEKAMKKKLHSYGLTIEERNDITEEIKGEDFGLRYVFATSLADIIKEQKNTSLLDFFKKKERIDIDATISYDDSKLKEQVEQLNCLDERNIVESKNAYISEYGNNGYTIIPEVPGTRVKADKLYELVERAVLALETSLSLEKTECYEAAEVTSKDSKLIEAMDEMNMITGAKITYEFGDAIETVDGTQISEWISVDDNYNVILHEQDVKEFVDYIGKNYNSFGKVRSFTTSYDHVLQISGGDYGWWLNRGQEVAELKELILTGAQQVKKPAYFQTAQQYGVDDIGGTYVEINLTAQHLFFYQDGILILETDVVTGNMSRDFGTPVGTYTVQYREKDATLVGENYSSPVKYWMPFNKNIGLHDASWRKEFGGDIYLKNGSHGCVNMPPDAAEQVYQYIKRGVAVVVYELPGTENYGEENNENKNDIRDIFGENNNW